MQYIAREDDLTVHICSDCYGQIIGPYTKEITHGVASYKHPHRCAPDTERLTRGECVGDVREVAAI